MPAGVGNPRDGDNQPMKMSKPKAQGSKAQAKKAGAPPMQKMPSTPPNRAESKTARPKAGGGRINTPPVPFTPKAPQARTKMAKM